MEYKANSRFQQSSDIFNLNNVNKPEITQKPHHAKTMSSCDIIAWTNPVADEAGKPHKKFVESNTMKSTVFSKEPLPQQRVRVIKGNETTFSFGNDDTSIYNVHKVPPEKYDPNKYYEKTTAYQRKIQQLYPEVTEVSAKKTSIGTLEKETQQYDDPKKGSAVTGSTAKERKFNELYKGDNYKSVAKPVPMTTKNSTDVRVDVGKKGTVNRIEMLKSNIFNDPGKDEENRKPVEVRPNDDDQEQHISVIRKKKNICTDPSEACFAKLKVLDENVNLLFKQPRDQVISQKNAEQRKIDFLYGEKGLQHEKENRNNNNENNDTQLRKELEFKFNREYPRENEAQIKKRIQNVAYMQNQSEVPSKTEPVNRTFEISGFKNSNDVNLEQIEKEFKNKGIHIHDVRNDNSYMDPNQKGKIVFSVRGGNAQKFEQLKKEIETENGIKIKEAVKAKREPCDTIPASVGWDHARASDFTKGRKLKATGQEKTHLKGKFGSEKITACGPINHGYKAMK